MASRKRMAISAEEKKNASVTQQQLNDAVLQFLLWADCTSVTVALNVTDIPELEHKYCNIVLGLHKCKTLMLQDVSPKIMSEKPVLTCQYVLNVLPGWLVHFAQWQVFEEITCCEGGEVMFLRTYTADGAYMDSKSFKKECARIKRNYACALSTFKLLQKVFPNLPLKLEDRSESCQWLDIVIPVIPCSCPKNTN